MNAIPLSPEALLLQNPGMCIIPCISFPLCLPILTNKGYLEDFSVFRKFLRFLSLFFEKRPPLAGYLLQYSKKSTIEGTLLLFIYFVEALRLPFQNGINQSIGFGFFRRHEIIPFHILFDPFQRLAGHFTENGVDLVLVL